ncbi:MAG: hypothetical protein QM756_04365 [Polyangiaceae bacterium]
MSLRLVSPAPIVLALACASSACGNNEVQPVTGATPSAQGGAAFESMGGASSGGVGEGGASSGDCTLAPETELLVGWAAVAGNGLDTTSGGGDLAATAVSDSASLNAALAGSAPAVVQLHGSVSGKVVVGSNKTLLGTCGASIHGDIHLSRSQNVIIRNLTVVGNDCVDSPLDCSGGADAISVSDGAHHLWFDHLDVSDGSDGNLDITSGSDFVTVSWTKFSYSSARTDVKAGANGHRFSNLIGSADNTTGDQGHLNVTFHHVWWADNVNQRMPRTRYGKVHVFDSLYTAEGNSYCVGVGMQSSVLVESNVFANVNSPLNTSSFADADSSLNANDNIYTNTTAGTGDLGVAFTPPYEYATEPASTVALAVRGGAGPH